MTGPVVVSGAVVEVSSQGRVMVPVENMAELDSLDAGARDIAITGMLDQARAWLAHAREASAPAREIADFKAFIASAADAARRVQVSKDIQLDADEMVRRSERALGLAIRKGQEAGEIVPTNAGRPRKNGTALGPFSPASPKEFIPSGSQTGTEIYAMTDGVTDDAFDEAIAEARSEENLSRANVVRKVKHVPSEETARIDRIREMAATGHSSRQIAKAVGLDQPGVAWRAKRFDIEIPADRIVSRTRHIDSNRIVRETVATLEGVALGIDMVEMDDLDEAEIQNWTDSLTTSIRALNRLMRQMKEKVQ